MVEIYWLMCACFNFPQTLGSPFSREGDQRVGLLPQRQQEQEERLRRHQLHRGTENHQTARSGITESDTL